MVTLRESIAFVARGDHQRALTQALTDAGFEAAPPPASLRMDMLPTEAQARVMHIYRALGGIQERPTLTPTSWDCALAGGLVVELDELQHFNRYRARTLEYAWALQIPWRAAYLGFCAIHESACIQTKASSKFWSTPKTELMFGTPSASKSLDGVGSPRWKQRALYDAMRDLAALNGVVKLARVSIFDDISGVPLGLALSGAARLDLNALSDFIAERTAVNR